MIPYANIAKLMLMHRMLNKDPDFYAISCLCRMYSDLEVRGTCQHFGLDLCLVWGRWHGRPLIRVRRGTCPQLFEGYCKIFIFDHWCPPRFLETYSSVPPVFYTTGRRWALKEHQHHWWKYCLRLLRIYNS